jgi:hypothetical protein
MLVDISVIYRLMRELQVMMNISLSTATTTVTTSDDITAIFFSNGSTAPWGPRPPHFSRLHDHTFRHTTVGRTPLDEEPARRRDFYLTTHNTHKRQTSMPPTGFEPTIPVSERPQTHALDRAATGIDLLLLLLLIINCTKWVSITTQFLSLFFPRFLRMVSLVGNKLFLINLQQE